MEIAQRANYVILLATSQRLVRPKRESFLSVDEMRSLEEVRDTVSGTTQLFLVDVVAESIRTILHRLEIGILSVSAHKSCVCLVA